MKPLTFSIVTPSFNKGQFIEDTIKSVISQKGDFYINYVIMDGGSSDCSVDIIKKYDQLIKEGKCGINCHGIDYRWISERDRGQTDALNKGFSRTNGEIMAYINADDKFCPWAFNTVKSIFTDCPKVKWLTSLCQLLWNSYGDPTPGGSVNGYTKSDFYKGRTLKNSNEFIGWIQQESTFWRRSLWEKAGGYMSEKLHYAMDFELWARFFKHADLYGVYVPLGGFRRHGTQKTADGNFQSYYLEADKVLALIKLREWKGEKAKFVYYDYTKNTWYTYEKVIRQKNFQLEQQKDYFIRQLNQERVQIDLLKAEKEMILNCLTLRLTAPLRKLWHLLPESCTALCKKFLAPK